MLDPNKVARNTMDADDPSIRGKPWEMVEKVLNQRDAYMASLSGYDLEHSEPRGPSFNDPCRPLYTTFPWEEKVEGFSKPASCTQKNWRHSCLKYKLGSQCATLELDTGDGANGLNPTVLDAFQDAIMDLQERSDVRVVILKSVGKFFSQGFDPKHLMKESTMSDEEIISFQTQFAKILYFMQRLPQLTVVLIQGTVMGAAIGLVCACDYVISVKGAFFTMSETKLGAVPATALPYITRRCTFIKNVYQLVLAGANLSAEVAEEYGFVDKVVDESKDLEAECQTTCDRMTLCAPGAVAATKEVVMNTVGVPPSSFMMNYVAGIMADIRAGPEGKAGMEAVQNKARPTWANSPIAP
mmetsp:Transcript_22367/g.42167  ORF Transcript_22367/g.42167 Transcript_22367/m.42167 type:complete len:355 (+) Transcript_22367:63-1127(+)